MANLGSLQVAFETWLSNAETWDLELGRAPETWLRDWPTLYIGLGSTGAKVLHHVANYLRGRWGLPWPTGVRLLQVVVSESDSIDEFGSASLYPTVSLFLDREKKRRLPFKRISWFDQKYLSNPGRALGRLAILADLADGKAQSQLWTALTKAVGDQRNLSVYIVADTFSDDGSGIVADLAHLVRQVAHPSQIGRITLCLAGQHAEWRDGLSPVRRSERTFATLRELRRFQRRTLTRFTYAVDIGQPELDAEAQGPLFDEIFLFDGLGEEVGGYRHDISALPAEDGLVPAVAGNLIALLDPHISRVFYEHAVNRLTEPARRGELPLEDIASAMGNFALRLPVEEMRQLMECRLIHKLLFQQETGLLGWETLDRAGKPQRRGPVAETSVEPDIPAFLEDSGLLPDVINRLSGEDFLRHLLAYLEHQLNLEPDISLGGVRKSLDSMEQSYAAFAPEIDKIRRSVLVWLDAVATVEKPSSSTDPLSSFLGTEATPSRKFKVTEGPLYQAWRRTWSQARSLFEQSARLHAHRLLWKLEDEPDLFERYIAPSKPWERMRRRLWWRWFRLGSRYELRLLIVPPNLDDAYPSEPHRTIRRAILRYPAKFALEVSQADQIIDRLTNLAKRCSKELAQENVADYLIEPDKLAQELERQSVPLYRSRRIGRERIAVEPFRYFSAPDRHPIQQVIRAIQGGTAASASSSPSSSYEFRFLANQDPTECRLLHVRHVLSLPNMEAYEAAREKYTPRAELHVFEAEQAVTRWEEQAERKLARDVSRIVFSPYFVELLYHQPEAVFLFGRSLVYGLIELDVKSMKVTFCDEAEMPDLVGQPAGGAVEQFIRALDQSPRLNQRIHANLAARRPERYDERLDLLDSQRDRMVLPLSRSGEAGAHDLALLMAAVIVEEERSE